MTRTNLVRLVSASCGVLSLLAASPVFAVGLGVNFVGNGSTIASGQGFGFIGQTNWNNAAGASGSMAAASETGGGSVNVSWLSAFTGNGTIPVFKDPATNVGACNLCTGPQDGYLQVLDGTIKAHNSFGTTGQQIEITFTGLNSVFSDYDVFVYFNATNDQGDQYEAKFDDGTTVFYQYPANPFPMADTAGRSVGDWTGYDDNGTLVGNSFSGHGDTHEDSMAISSTGYLISGTGDLTGDTLTVTVSDLNNNSNDGTPTFLGGNNIGPNADLGVAGIQIIGNLAMTFDPADTDKDGDVDTADLTTMFQNFNGAGGTGKTMMDGDTDMDGDVDTADITTGLQNFTGAMSGLATVPEPGTFVLMGLGLLGLVGYGVRRKRQAS